MYSTKILAVMSLRLIQAMAQEPTQLKMNSAIVYAQ
jgi:hypothetical protein